MTETITHWADAAAERLLARGRTHVINTGITPSGPIHVGNSREILTADAVHRALKDKDATSTLNYIADSFDPLRRVYPFLDASYEAHVGKPLNAVPCPCSRHDSYADHFLEPFLAGAAELGVDLTLVLAHRLYEEGAYSEAIFDALDGRDAIAAILEEETDKRIAADWSPFRPLCPGCGRLDRSVVRGWDRAAGTISAACACGWEGEVSAAGGGKLTWRVDWPARWRILGCTFEPFGKDHATRGGSWDTGSRISREVFGFEPPDFVLYEWISLKGMGDMSSSKGNVMTIGEMLDAAPPEVLRFLIMDRQPQRALELDPARGIPALLTEYDRRGRESPADRAYVLSRVSGAPPCPVPFMHLVTAVQVAEATVAGRAGGDGDEEVLGVLARSGYRPESEAERKVILERARYARRWLDRFAPEDVRFTLQEELPPGVRDLSPSQRRALGMLAGELREGMDGEAIHATIHRVKDRAGLGAGRMFEAVYVAFLGKGRGPRAGEFLASLDGEWARGRLREAAGEEASS